MLNPRNDSAAHNLLLIRGELERIQQTGSHLEDHLLKKGEEERQLGSTIVRLESELAELKHANGKLQNELNQFMQENDLLFDEQYARRKLYYESVLNAPVSAGARALSTLLAELDYKAIMVYPPAVKWEPQQRPQHMLKEFATAGYLCFFCDSTAELELAEAVPNLYVVKREQDLLVALQSHYVLVLNTWLMQNAWIDCLPHRTLWYDILDRVDFFSLYDRNMLLKHYEVLSTADIVTYSAKALSEFCEFREDALYLPNAANAADFFLPAGSKGTLSAFDDLNAILANGRKIIGYFGAIEEWFDREMVESIVRRYPVDIVLIGHCGVNWSERPDNIHLLGQKPYGELKEYSRWFDALIIPFIVNDLTNCVSPVKFFEYCCLQKPIIAAPIAELLPYQGEGIHIVNDASELILNERFWKLSSAASQHLSAIAQRNQWSDRAHFITALLEEQPAHYRIYANRAYSRHISVFTSTFLDFDGGNFYSGGAERYLLDLHDICSELGYELDVYQYGNYPWFRKYKDVHVYSLGYDKLTMHDFTVDAMKRFSHRFAHTVDGKFALHLYSAFFQAYPAVAHPSIGISHGVAWDHPGCSFTDGGQFWASNERFLTGARNVQTLVSVDTNTANWFQTVAYDVSMEIHTIPNYVDTDQFAPAERTNKRLRIVYPRRLYSARGLYLTLDVVDDILGKYPDTEFHFVGKGFPEDVGHIEAKIKKWPDRIFLYHRDPEDMHEVYQSADIVLIPTLHSEGTSLSCLEACASGCVIISTRVGGLTDIIIDDYNGLLIAPNTAELREALNLSLSDQQLRRKLSRNAISVAAAFNKQKWKLKWKKVLTESLNDAEAEAGGEISASPQNTGRLRTVLVPHWPNDPAVRESAARTILRRLKDGCAVLIRTENEKQLAQSFGRLQWIGSQEELYFEPDEVLELKLQK